jgi:dTMP kinase
MTKNRGRIIVIEGTDCSGKETQSNRLMETMKKSGRRVQRLSFPMYDTPTGRIVGGPYLGKPQISAGWFAEGAPNVNSKVASLYYAADRLYNLPKIEKLLSDGVDVILDRYVWSNFAHQGGKIADPAQRSEMYEFLEKLEFELLGLPRPDLTIFLHMPYEVALKLRQARTAEAADQHESNPAHLRQAEKTYLELAKKYHFQTIKCAIGTNPRPIAEIAAEVYKLV